MSTRVPLLATLAIIWQMKPVMWNSGASDTMPEPGGRPAFRAAIRESLTAHLENTYVVDQHGNKTKLKKKKP